MDAKFKCSNCLETFQQRMEDLRQVDATKWNPKGLMADSCPHCGHAYMTCINFKECLAHSIKLDKEKGWVN